MIAYNLLGFFVEGVSTLLFVMLFFGRLQLIVLGIIGEYLSRIYDETKRRPLYLVSERRNVEGPGGLAMAPAAREPGC